MGRERKQTKKNPPAKNVRNWRETRIRNSRTKWGWPSFESLKFFAEELPVDFFLSFFREFGSAVLRVEGFRAILSSSRARARAVLWKRKSWIIFQNLLAKVGRRRGGWTRAMMASVVEEGVENAVDCAAKQHTGGSSAGTQLEIMGRELKCAIW